MLGGIWGSGPGDLYGRLLSGIELSGTAPERL
jgi:hypothetical protein